jgi:hypothetical protein
LVVRWIAVLGDRLQEIALGNDPRLAVRAENNRGADPLCPHLLGGPR